MRQLVLIALWALAAGSRPSSAADAPRVYGQHLTLNWFDNSNKCWFRIDRRGGVREFIVVDTRDGSRTPCFDYGEVTAQIERLSGTPDEVVHLEYEEMDDSLLLVATRGLWRLELSNGQLSSVEGASDPPNLLTPIGDVTRSRGQGADTTIAFRNDSQRAVTVDWINVGGEPVFYFELAPGECRLQATHARHVWRVRAGARELVYRATAKPSSVIISSNSLAADQTRGPATDTRVPLPPLASPPADRKTGVESAVTFKNTTDRTAEIGWLRDNGTLKHFFTLSPGESRRQQTFDRHVWRVVVGGSRSWFQAIERSGVAIIESDSLTADGGEEAKASLACVTSPDGEWEAFVRDDKLWVRRAHGGSEHRLSDLGTIESSFRRSAQRRRAISLVYDQPDYPVSLPDVRWSPDSRYLVAIRTDVVAEPTMTVVSSRPVGSSRPQSERLPYLRPGDAIPEPHLHLFSVATLEEIQLPQLDTRGAYRFDHMSWDDESQAFFFVHQARGHRCQRLYRIEPREARTIILAEESPDTFVDYSNKTFVQHLTETDELLWMSERSGWNHLYVIPRTVSGEPRPISAGPYVVKNVIDVDAEERVVYAMVRGYVEGQDHSYEHLVRFSLDGADPVALTASDAFHEVIFSPDRRHFVDTASRVDLAPCHTLRRSDDGSLVCELETADISELTASGFRPPERFTAPGRDGRTPIDGIIHVPRDFDPAQRYPVIENIYASPSGQYVPKTFRSRYRHQQEIADSGFVVVNIDGMGTNWRSKAFQDLAWKNLADAGFPDRIAWIKHAGLTRPWMDLSRVGVYGGSAGGQNAMRALIDHHDFYRVAVADCGCHDNRIDKLWWNEAWMGWPVDQTYARSSNVEHAHRLRGNLLLTVGEVDRNVDPASTFQVVDALRRADKNFELLVFPGLGHAAIECEYGRRKRIEFFRRHLLVSNDYAAKRPTATDRTRFIDRP